MKKQYTLLAVVGFSLSLLVTICYWVMGLCGVGLSILPWVLPVVSIIAQILILPFFVSLYKNLKK